jgi:hypothetical protein
MSGKFTMPAGCALGGLMLAASMFGTSAFAQQAPNREQSTVVVFLKSPFYAKVEQAARGTGEKAIDPAWCRPGADLAAFPWSGEFETVGRGNNPMPLAHSIMSDPDGTCRYFTVYASYFSVLPDLAKKLAQWSPALPRGEDTTASVTRPQLPAAVAGASASLSAPPLSASAAVIAPAAPAPNAPLAARSDPATPFIQPEPAAVAVVSPPLAPPAAAFAAVSAARPLDAIEEEHPPLPRPKPPLGGIKPATALLKPRPPAPAQVPAAAPAATPAAAPAAAAAAPKRNPVIHSTRGP